MAPPDPLLLREADAFDCAKVPLKINQSLQDGDGDYGRYYMTSLPPRDIVLIFLSLTYMPVIAFSIKQRLRIFGVSVLFFFCILAYVGSRAFSGIFTTLEVLQFL